MRHLRSILYALVLAPAVWILCGVGFDQDLTGRARDNGGIESLSGVLLLLLAGAAYAILLFSPISPAGPLLAGVVLAGVGAWARIAPDSYAGVWPAGVAKEGFDVSTPGYGLAVLLAVPLLAVALSARRWRGFVPPEILLIGTIGRATVAGTPMASERTTVIPEQRRAPGFGAPSADVTQIVPPPRPAPDRLADATQVVPPPRPVEERAADDGDEKTTVMQLARPSEPATEDIALPSSPAPAPAASGASAQEEVTRDVTGEETTRVVVPAAVEDDRTQLLTPPRVDGEAQTEAVRAGTVDPPGDRTQVLTFRPPPAEETTSRSIAGAERPDPGEDPTTRLTPPGEATTRATPEARRPMSVSSLERPADEAADDTRPLTLPAQRPPAEDDPTRRL